MRKIYTLILALVVSVATYGQLEFPFTEGFEAFTADEQFVAQVTSTLWTTWSEDPGSAEDPYISTAEAATGSNSILVEGSNDLVFLTGDLAEGRYKVKLSVLIPESYTGYYNFLQEFAGADSKWGYQIQFDGGVAAIDGNGTVNADYTPGEWINTTTFVDLDADWCEIYFNDVLVHSFQWSVGTSATNSKTWGAINFYAWAPDGGTSKAYFDDLTIEEVDAATPPANLLATLENGNDVALTWDAPDGTAPVKYILTRSGLAIAELTETSYTDMNVYPSPYVYGVRAVYDNIGTSSADTNSIDIAGYVDRQFVLFEHLNTAGADHQNPSNKGLKQISDSVENLAIVAYHYDDTYANDEGYSRLFEYYQPYYAGLWSNGILAHANSTQVTGSFYDTYRAIYDGATINPSVITMGLEVTANADGTYTAKVDLTEEFAYFESGLKLRLAITESNIEDAAGYQGQLNFVCRTVDVDGIDVAFVDGSQSVSVDFSLEGDAPAENYELVAFVQHDPTQSVNQAVTAAIPGTEPKVNITFNVDMTNADGFDSSADVVYVTGTFAGPSGWDEPGTGESVMLSDEDGDMIYTGMGAAPLNDSIAYKYFINAGWATGDPGGDRAVMTVDVDLVTNDVWGIVGVTNNELGLVEMYPNPFNNTLTIDNLENVNQITISNVVGQAVMVINVDEMTEVISTSDLNNGIYFVTVVDANNNVRTERVVKQ